MDENDILSYMIEWENGELGLEKTLQLFSYLVKTGQAWTLQGCYGRFAKMLIEEGYLEEDGDILYVGEDV